MISRRSLLHTLALAPLIALPTSLSVAKKPSKEEKKAAKKARKARDRAAVREALIKGEILSLAQILLIIEANASGEVIEIELERDNAMFIYKVKLLEAGGKVRKLKLDARDGRVLGQETK